MPKSEEEINKMDVKKFIMYYEELIRQADEQLKAIEQKK
nr:MAG TPA: hypothetical protein [Caudoviricetes sp.]